MRALGFHFVCFFTNIVWLKRVSNQITPCILNSRCLPLPDHNIWHSLYHNVKLGGQMKATTAIKTCQATVSGHSSEILIDCRSLWFTRRSNFEAEAHFYQEKKKMGTNEKFSTMFNVHHIIGGKINGEDLLFFCFITPNLSAQHSNT